MKYTSICAAMIFVKFVTFVTAQRNHALIVNTSINNYRGLNRANSNFRFTLTQTKNDKAIEQQQRILEQLTNLLITDIDNGGKQPSPAAKLARQRPFALVSPKPIFLRCIEKCPTTNQYNPVCGSDHQTYHNVYKLHCAFRCGKNVQMDTIGICPLDF